MASGVLCIYINGKSRFVPRFIRESLKPDDMKEEYNSVVRKTTFTLSFKTDAGIAKAEELLRTREVNFAGFWAVLK